MATANCKTGFSAERIPCEECGTLFLPKRAANIFCSKRCGQRHRYKEKQLQKQYIESGYCPHNSGVFCTDANCTRCGFYPPVEKERKEKLEQQYGIRWVAE